MLAVAGPQTRLTVTALHISGSLQVSLVFVCVGLNCGVEGYWLVFTEAEYRCVVVGFGFQWGENQKLMCCCHKRGV